LNIPFVSVSECKFCTKEPRGVRIVPLLTPKHPTHKKPAQHAKRNITKKIKTTNRSTTTAQTVAVTTTTVPPQPIKKPVEDKMPIHVNDCIRVNTADIPTLRNDRSVGVVVEVFRSDLLEGRPIWLRAHFPNMKLSTPFSFNEVTKVPCMQHGVDPRTVSGVTEATDATGSDGPTGSTGATGASELTGATGVIEATSTTGVSSGSEATGMTGTEEIGIPKKPHEEDSSDDFVAKLVSTKQLVGDSTKKPFITAQQAVSKNNDKLLHGRTKREALSSAVAFLRAARHRDAVFARAVTSGTHVVGFSNIVQQVKKLGALAMSARKSYAAMLKLTSPSEVLEEQMQKLDDRARFILDRTHPVGTVLFSDDECHRSKKMFHICPVSFGCQAKKGSCVKCPSCGKANIGSF